MQEPQLATATPHTSHPNRRLGFSCSKPGLPSHTLFSLNQFPLCRFRPTQARGDPDCCDMRSGRGQGDMLNRNQPLTFAKHSHPLSVIHSMVQMLLTHGTRWVIAWRFNKSHTAVAPRPSSCRCLRLEEVWPTLVTTRSSTQVSGACSNLGTARGSVCIL